ncbi:hypothetical protein AZF37_06895 [endosymbiont 'TC1' of Trimyema compressum]|uniref:alanine racemase n=1 Tax=endosymbiont 'TC1' of Trimyema compressum TaxID=243899 RepID=UPI0007F1333A|nr:alanine racemase [endosymbiont 'TC1' of Trimyema compressum]AMP20926.1 hypothetical protein AZF37_06895 [endosymbiont 'TC1' of Trimyema compressum]
MRAVWAEIDLNSVEHNVREIKKILAPSVGIMAIIKANGYGHGASPLSFAIENDVDGFGVALMGEGIALREGGIGKPILVLGYTDEMEYPWLIENNITQTIFTLEQAIALNNIGKKMNKKGKVHLKIETGMNRLGFSDNKETIKAIEEMKSLEYLEVEGIFSHMANGGCEDLSYSQKQLERFKIFAEQLEAILEKPLTKHLANSATLIEMPETHFQMVRAGILLYGSFSTNHSYANKLKLKKPLTLKGKIVQIKTMEKGEPISYEGTFVTERKTKVAVLPIGYADGISRQLSNKGCFLVHGQKAKIIGNVCMDQLMLDVTDIPNVKVKDEVILYGEDNPVETFADILGTIPYEVYCSISERIPRVYMRK